MSDNIRIRYNTGSGYNVLHPETNVDQVLHTDGKRLSEVINEFTDSENIIIGEIEGITSNTLQGAIEELATAVNSNVGDVLRVSHKTPAQVTSPVSLQFNRGFTAGTAYDSISLVEDNNPTTNLITSKTASTINSSGFGSDQYVINLLVENGLLPNKDYTGNIPLEALKDANGNDIAGAYVFKFKTKSIIAEAGSLLNLVATVNAEGTAVSVSWTNPEGVDLVNIIGKRDTVGYVTDMNNGTTVYNALGTSFVDSNVALDTEYYYTLFTIDSTGEFNNTSRIKVLVEKEEEKAPYIVILTPEVSITELNAAIPSLPDNTELLFTEGNYDLDSRIIIDRSNITLRGTSGTFLNKTKDINTSDQHGLISVVGKWNNYLSNVRFINLNLNGNYSTSGETGTNTFIGSGISAQYAGKVMTNTNTSYDSSKVGVKTDVVNGVLIKNCVIKSFKDYGIILTNSSNNTITGNVVQNIDTDSGIQMMSSNNNTVIGNTVSDTSAGISLATSNSNTIIGNNVYNISTFCIYLNAVSTSNIVKSNIVRGASIGIYVYSSSSNNTIQGNTVQGNTNSGLYLNQSSNNNVVIGNTFQDNTYQGIYVYTSSSNNVIIGNTLSNNHETTDLRIDSGSNDNVVCANTTNLNITDGGTNNILQHNIQY